MKEHGRLIGAKPIHGVILVMVSLILLGGSCAPSVSQEQCDALRSELDATKRELDQTRAELDNVRAEVETLEQHLEDQLAGPRATWSSLRPKLELGLLIMDNFEVWTRESLGEITAMEKHTRTLAQASQLERIMKELENHEELVNHTQGWWVMKGTVQTKHLVEMLTLLRTLDAADIAKLSEELQP